MDYRLLFFIHTQNRHSMTILRERKLTVVLKYQFQAAVFLLKNWIYGGCIKVAFFEDTAGIGRYRRVHFYLL